MPTAKRAISSRVTIKNPRPRKYATAAEKQAAFRSRFPTICVRVEPKTADTIQKIGDASGRTQQETMLSLVKFALTNRDFVNLGLTEHKQLPRMEETRKANPMKRKPTPAQIAARERFAEMARSGAFKRKAKRNPAKKRNPRASNPIILVSDKPIATKRKANPVKPKVPKYTVQTLISDKAKWKRVAMFDSLEQAKAYAEAVPRAYKVVAVRVIDDK